MDGFRYHMMLLLTLVFSQWAGAQQGIFIPEGAKVFLAGDTAGFFSGTTLRGNLGVASKAVVSFTGNLWQQDNLALLTDEQGLTIAQGGKVGTIHFAASGSRQLLDGGFNAATRQGPQWGGLTLANPHGLELTGSGAKVGKQLQLASGMVWLNSQTMVVGHGHPGTIMGYGEKRFLVTAPSAGGGTLVREGLDAGTGPVVFPLGTAIGSYTPLSVRLWSREPDDFSASVFDQVRTQVHSGYLLAQQTVNKTWELGKRNKPDSGSVEVTVQHPENTGGNYYRRNIKRAYLSMFNNNRWDSAALSLIGTGTLTTGSPSKSAVTHQRLLNNVVGNSTYLTLMVPPDPDSREAFNFYGYRMDAGLTQLEWGVQPETNVQSYIVQRWFANGRGFSQVDTILSKAANRYSAQYLYYQAADDNNYRGVTYYRLLIRHFDDPDTFSQTIAIAGTPGKLLMHLWPNPTPDVTIVSLSTSLTVDRLVVWNLLGQKLMELSVNGRRIIRIDLRPFAQGMYVVGMLSPSGELMATEKVIKSNR